MRWSAKNKAVTGRGAAAGGMQCGAPNSNGPRTGVDPPALLLLPYASIPTQHGARIASKLTHEWNDRKSSVASLPVEKRQGVGPRRASETRAAPTRATHELFLPPGMVPEVRCDVVDSAVYGAPYILYFIVPGELLERQSPDITAPPLTRKAHQTLTCSSMKLVSGCDCWLYFQPVSARASHSCGTESLMRGSCKKKRPWDVRDGAFVGRAPCLLMQDVKYTEIFGDMIPVLRFSGSRTSVQFRLQGGL